MNNSQDLRDRTMVVTGADAGMGRDVLQALAARGACVIGVGRSPERCRAAQQAVLAEASDTRVTFVPADLGSQREVRRLAADIGDTVQRNGWDSLGQGGWIDALIHGAQARSRWRQVTEDGYELHFAVNHLAPFLLTRELLPLLRAAPSGRIVTLVSSAHRRGRMKWSDVMVRRGYTRRAAYGQSQLAAALWTVEMNRRLGDAGTVRAYLADRGAHDPGAEPRGLLNLDRPSWRGRNRWRARVQGQVETVVLLATEPPTDGRGWVYWRRGRPARLSPRARQSDEAARLWTMSQRLCGLSDDD